MYVTSPVSKLESHIPHSNEILTTVDNSLCQEMTYDIGETIFYSGDDADYVYEVIEGVVKSTKVLIDGRRQVLNFCYPGDMIGLSHDCVYHCDCDAVSKVRVRLHRKNACREDISKNPEFCAQLLRNAAAEVNSMQDHFLMLGRKSATEKLASFLIAVMEREENDHADEIVFELPMKRSDIADFLGMTIETVSRNLTKLRKLGVIDLPTMHRVIVCKPGKLRALAENGT